MQTVPRRPLARLDFDDSLPPRASGSTAPTSTRLRYVPGLDGLRAISVTAVLLYHGDVSWMPAGFLGVDVFFVISGYLITSLLLAEHRGRGGVNLGQFYLRRARRLLPALGLLLASVSLFSIVFLPDEIRSLRADVVASLGYVTNWWQIFQQQSYTSAQGRPPLLRHLWSLAVEEQFYLLWPLLLAGMLKVWNGRRLPMLIATGVGIVASFVTMLVLSFPHDFAITDPSRVYFGTDTRIFTMLIGAALAIVWPPWRLSNKIPLQARILLDAIGGVALALLVAIFVSAHYQSNALFRGGFLGVALLSAVVIGAAVHPASRLGTVVLAQQPLRWLGERSYGIYLWHWPIFMLTRPELDLPITGTANLVVRLVLTLAVAELSYRFVEEPIRHGALGRWFGGLRTATGEDRSIMWQRTAMTCGAVVVVVGLSAFGLASGQAARIEPELRFLNAPEETTTTTTTTTVPGAPPTTPTTPTTPPPAPAVTAIGDSVMLGAKAALEQKIPGIRVDALTSRQFGSSIDIIRALKETGQLSPVVLIHLGTNGTIVDAHMEALKPLLEDRARVIFVNVKVPRTWEASDNAVIQRWVPLMPNAVLINWNGEASARPEYLAGDRIHMNTDGMIRYADLVAAAVNP